MYVHRGQKRTSGIQFYLHPPPCSIETAFLTDPGAVGFSNLKRGFCLCPPQCLGYRCVPDHIQVFMWLLLTQTQVLRFTKQVLLDPEPSPSILMTLKEWWCFFLPIPSKTLGFSKLYLLKETQGSVYNCLFLAKEVRKEKGVWFSGPCVIWL